METVKEEACASTSPPGAVDGVATPTGGRHPPAVAEVAYSPRELMRYQTIEWNICDECGQSTSVERGFAPAQQSDRWVCAMNTWNPKMAACWSEQAWNQDYRAFIEEEARKKSPESSDLKDLTRPPLINGEAVNLWGLYNFITQMGGWATVKRHGWLPIIYDYHNWSSTAIAFRLRSIYETYLLGFENKFFQGKRYDTADEYPKLFRPRADIAAASPPPPCSLPATPSITTPQQTGTKKRRRAESFTGSSQQGTRLHAFQGQRVWVKLRGSPWWPAQTILPTELSGSGSVVPESVLSEFDSSPADTLLRLYGSHEWYFCEHDDMEVLLAWELREPMTYGIPTLAAAIEEAQRGGQTCVVKDASGKAPLNRHRRRCAQVTLPRFPEKVLPYDSLEEEEQSLRQAERELEAKLKELRSSSTRSREAAEQQQQQQQQQLQQQEQPSGETEGGVVTPAATESLPEGTKLPLPSPF